MAAFLLVRILPRLQAPVAAFLILAGLQLAAAVAQPPASTARTAFGVRGALAAPLQSAPERS